ncbi:MAG: C39 family peptidase [Chloroflexota bacterium]|nr:C39 family peptidase [Chloroflexota bacterium]
MILVSDYKHIFLFPKFYHEVIRKGWFPDIISTIMRKKQWFILLFIPITLLVLAALYRVPAINDRLAWRVDVWRAKIKYTLNPPEEEFFIPEEGQNPITPTAAFSPTPTPTTFTATVSGPSETPLPSPTPTLTATPLPESVNLDGIIHEFQKWNNCGPANLSMALSFWGWEGDQRDTAAYLKPNQRDKNVMPYEMVAYVNEETELNALWRVGGDLVLIKKFVAAGFPVLVEKGFEGTGFDGWMGHYEVINAYDNARQRFLAQDSYIMPDLPVPYEQMQTYWQQFNYTYIIIYPPEREAEVMALLGPQADEDYNYQYAADKASEEIFAFEGRDRAFAWFNRGTNLAYLDDYMGAADAYDEFFAIYATLDADEVNIPWRITWYQTRPYWAYFYSGRYYDVLSLTTTTIDTASEPAIEESWYWRALAKEALGDTNSAIADLQHAVELNENFDIGWYQLERIRGGG